MLSAPKVIEPICGGKAQIAMGAGTAQEIGRQAQELAVALRAGALPAPVTVESVRVIGPTS